VLDGSKRTNFEKQDIVYRDNTIRITISIGIATFDEETFETIEDLIRRADEYLYEAKQLGRNRTILKNAA